MAWRYQLDKEFNFFFLGCATVNATAMRMFGSDMPGDAFKPAVRPVGIVVYEGFSLLGIGMVLEVFRRTAGTGAVARGEGGAQGVMYDVQMLSEEGGSVKGAGGVEVQTREIDDYAQECANTPLVAGPFEHDPYELVRDALVIVSRDFGETAVREIAEYLLPGAGDRLLPAPGDMDTVKHKVRRGAQWLVANCARTITIEDAAAEVAMSRRNFLRKFRIEMGSTPSEYLLKARLELASRLLAQTELPVDKIARRCALSNGDNLAKIFRKKWSISPTEYRSHQRWVGRVV